MTAVREHDIALFGATGSVGRLVARYLLRHVGWTDRVALAGRSREKLAALRADLGPAAGGWPLVTADAHDEGSLEALARGARVVATTVGPYARYGLGLVGACARAGTHYADITGEVLFVRECIDRFHEVAGASGARIVHACGYDSIPSDLGVLLLAKRAGDDGDRGDRDRRRGLGELGDTTLVVRSARGGIGGGTVDSLRAQVDAVRGDPTRARIVADPYALSPDRGAEPPSDGSDGSQVAFDRGLGTWTGPFVMAPFNTRIVRRSNALQGWAYGHGFRYREVVGFGRAPMAPVLAGAMAAGIRGLVAGMAWPPSRAVLDRVLPGPGEAPDEGTLANGHFRMDVHTTTADGGDLRAVVAAQGDPGFAATAMMLGESALALADDAERLPDHRGVLTPATGLGLPLAQRLRDAGFRLTVDRR